MLLLLLLLASVLSIPLGLNLYSPGHPRRTRSPLEKMELGKRLFADSRLSRDGTIACSSCHDPARAFSDGRAKAIGVFGRQGRRNAPAIVNRGYGRPSSGTRGSPLEEQVLKPIAGPERDGPADRGRRGARWSRLPIELSQALASYVRSILSGDAPYDRFVNGDRSALSAGTAGRPTDLPREGNCTACHVGPTFTDERTHNTGIAWRVGRVGFSMQGEAALR